MNLGIGLRKDPGGFAFSYERGTPAGGEERQFFIDNLLVRIHYIIVMIM